MIMGNMYRNTMGPMNPAMSQSMGSMNPLMNGVNPAMYQSLNNMNIPMTQSFRQSNSQKGTDGSKNYDQTNIEDVLANNMNNLNQFYSYINNQNKDMMNNMNLASSSNNQGHQMNNKRQVDLNESVVAKMQVHNHRF